VAYLKVDENYQTSSPGIYATGDIVGPPWLAHVATYRAIQAVNGMFEHSKPIPFDAFPGCTYCQPQVASIGITEEKAKEDGIDYKVGKFPFAASGKAVAVNHSEGFVKVIVGEKYGEILGAHIIGSDATELITEYGLAMNLEATVDEIHGTIHAHPTMSEALAEAAAAAHGEAYTYLNKFYSEAPFFVSYDSLLRGGKCKEAEYPTFPSDDLGSPLRYQQMPRSIE
jgi:dihydrolipoamide dehydrogenase